MWLSFLKAKIHRATVTEANVNYQGSIGICPTLLEVSGIKPFEKVEIYNVTNGERFATYAIVGEPGSICLNGAAALKVSVNDLVIIAAYCYLTPEEVGSHKPNLVFVDEKNQVASVTNEFTSKLYPRPM